ncbi:Y14A, partial [Symbiodinium necroappetens]
IFSLACGGHHTAAVGEQCQVMTWGGGAFGKLGHGNRLAQTTPKVVIALQGKRVVQVALGPHHSAALTQRGEVFTWGQAGRLGHASQGAEVDEMLPRPVAALSHVAVAQISCGHSHCAVVTETGDVWAWGSARTYGHTEQGAYPNVPTMIKASTLHNSKMWNQNRIGFNHASGPKPDSTASSFFGDPTMDVDYDDEVAEEGARPAGRRMKGRGGEEDDRYAGKAGKFERLDDDDDETGAARSIEGWVVIVSGVHEEAQEDDIFEAFSEYGDIKNLHLNLDRRTGFVKGYAFIEYENKQEADAAIKAMDGNTLLDHKLDVSWAFAKPGSKKKRR